MADGSKSIRKMCATFSAADAEVDGLNLRRQSLAMRLTALIVALVFSLAALCIFHAARGTPFEGPKPPVESAPPPVHIQPGVEPYNGLCRAPGFHICENTA
jgi:hypothetical protein